MAMNPATPVTDPRGDSRVSAPITLPTFSLLTLVPLASLIIGLTWYFITIWTGRDTSTAIAGPAGAGVVAVVAVISILVMTPWKSRPMDLWMTFWLAGTVVRLLVTPAGAFLLYSATPLPASALALSVALAYLVTVLTESIVLARHVRKHC